MDSIYKKISEIEKSNDSAALCTIISTTGSTPRKTGTKMIVYEDGSIYGTVGGGSLEKKVVNNAIEIIKNKTPQVLKYILSQKEGMGCGGSNEIFIEPITGTSKLIIFGAGHIGKTLAKFAKQVNFSVTLVDDRKEIFDGFDTTGFQIIQKNYNEAFEELNFDSNTYIASITREHSFDRDIIAYCAKQAYAFLGMIGSKAKIATAKKIFLSEKILTEQQMSNINWPMGIDIKCNTPEEIAVSILAKLIDTRSKLN
ncbi:MAG: XdhC family protein [Bacteroidales bacterium]|nr:XdhC family protein [Bacteroidales bacterium]